MVALVQAFSTLIKIFYEDLSLGNKFLEHTKKFILGTSNQGLVALKIYENLINEIQEENFNKMKTLFEQFLSQIKPIQKKEC